MIKKLIVFVCFLLIVFSANLSIKALDEHFEGDIISEIGIGKDSMIFTEGVREISGKVDWNVSGTYEVLCTKDNKDSFVRNVMVKSQANLEEGIDIIKEIGSFDFSKNNIKEIISSNVLVINRNEYFAYYNCLLKNDNNVSFVCKYKKDEVSIVYSVEDYSAIGGMCLYNNSLYVLITVYEEGLGKIQISKFDMNLNLLSSNRYYSNKDDIAKAIYSFDESLYLFIDATSNQGIIERSASNKIVLVLKINPYNFVIEKYLEIGNNYDNELVNVKLSNSNFFLYLCLNGSSGKYYHSINKSYTGNFILKVNGDLETSIYKNLENDIKNCVDVTFNDTSILYVWKENLNKIVVKFGEYNKEKTVSINEFKGEITAISSIIYADFFYIFVSLDNILSKVILIKDENISVKNLDSLPYNCNDVYCYNGEIYLKMKGSSTRLFAYNNLKIQKFNEKIIVNNKEILCQNIKIFINNVEVESQNLKIEINDKYGNYVSLASALCENYLVLFKCKYNIPLVCNVKDNECYDSGLILNFNGQATLNDVNIESGYVLTEIGKYQLDIIGENAENVKINFEILDVLVSNLEKDKQINLALEYAGYEKSDNTNVEYELDQSKNYYEAVNESNYIAYIIFIIVALYLIYLFGYKKYYKKKKEKK